MAALYVFRIAAAVFRRGTIRKFAMNGTNNAGIHCVSKKNDNDVRRYNFNAHQPILTIFGRDIAE